MEDLLGFQVVDKDNEIHPNMDASFCIYSFKDAVEMFKDDKVRWRLLPIFEGDIEEPTLMF